MIDHEKVLKELRDKKQIFEKEGWTPEDRYIFDHFLYAKEIYLLFDKYFHQNDYVNQNSIKIVVFVARLVEMCFNRDSDKMFMLCGKES